MTFQQMYKSLSAQFAKNAEFDGKFELPVIYGNEEKIIPVDMIPFEKRTKYRNETDLFIHFYMHDQGFKQLLSNPDKYIEELKNFRDVISPDFSLYRDVPFLEQAVNSYVNRTLGYYMQKKGLYVIPNVRWSDSRSFEYCFDGLEKRGIYCISTHGCIKKNEDKFYFKQGLEEFIHRLEPETVLVHGAMPDDVFSEYTASVDFVHYKSYTAKVFSGGAYGNGK